MVFDLFGLIGLSLYVLSYALLQLGRISGNGYLYAGMNLGAAAFTLLAMYLNFNIWSALIQVFFMTFSIIGMTRMYLISRRLTFNEFERILLEARFNFLDPVSARKLLNAGEWKSIDRGTVFVKQGEMVSGLFFVCKGEAAVQVQSKQVALVQPGSFIGELTALNNQSATASVLAKSAMYVFLIPRDRLQRLVKTDTIIATAITAAMYGDVTDKLKRANAAPMVARS